MTLFQQVTQVELHKKPHFNGGKVKAAKIANRFYILLRNYSLVNKCFTPRMEYTIKSSFCNNTKAFVLHQVKHSEDVNNRKEMQSADNLTPLTLLHTPHICGSGIDTSAGLPLRMRSHSSPVIKTLTGVLWASSQVLGPGPSLQQSASGEQSHFKKMEIKWKNVCSLTDVIICPGLTSVRKLECQVHFNMCQYLVAVPGMCTCVYFQKLCILAPAAATFHSDILHPFNICVFM